MDRQVEKMSWEDYVNQEPGEYRLRWIIDYGWIEWEPVEPTPNYNYLFGVTGNNSHHWRGNPDGEDGEHAYVSLALPTSSEIGRSDRNNFYHEFFRLGTMDESGDWKYDEKTKIGFIEFMRRWQFDHVGPLCVESIHRCRFFPVDTVCTHHREFAETYSYFIVKEGLVKEGVLPAEAYIRRVDEEYTKQEEEGTRVYWGKSHQQRIDDINIHLKRINIELTLTVDSAGNDKYDRIEKDADLLALAYYQLYQQITEKQELRCCLQCQGLFDPASKRQKCCNSECGKKHYDKQYYERKKQDKGRWQEHKANNLAAVKKYQEKKGG